VSVADGADGADVADVAVRSAVVLVNDGVATRSEAPCAGETA
jgi:hypothetical protein